MNDDEYEPPLTWDPDLDPGFDWTTFGLALGGGAALLIGAWFVFRR